MSFYLLPTQQKINVWLAQHAEGPLEVSPEMFRKRDGSAFAVVFVQGASSARLAYNLKELHKLSDPRDHRPKLWFWVPRSVLLRDFPDFQHHVEDE